MHAGTASRETTRPNQIVRCGFQCNCTTCALGAAGSSQPFIPPSTSVGGPSEAPSAVAVQPLFQPSPETTQQPVGQEETVIVRPVREVPVTVAVGRGAAVGLGAAGFGAAGLAVLGVGVVELAAAA